MKRRTWSALSVCLLVLGCQQTEPPTTSTNNTTETESATATETDRVEPADQFARESSASSSSSKAASDSVDQAARESESPEQSAPPEPIDPGKTTGKDEDGLAKAPGAVGDFIIAEPLRHGNLTIFPILSAKPKNQDRFITLREGLESGKVEIFEVGAAPIAGEESDDQPEEPVDSPEVQGDVNMLMVLNRSETPLYLLPGEIIVGGKQDRAIAKEGIVPPSNKPTAVEVFCVEAGRWSRRGDDETSEVVKTLSEDGDEEKARMKSRQAKQGQFVVSAGNLGSLGRLTVHEGKGQGAVWEEVAKRNAKSGAKTKTNAFTQNYVQGDVADKIKKYREHFEKTIGEREQVVGVMIAVNDVILWVDVFESTPLFRKLWPTLLKGFAVDAISLPDLKAGKRCTVQDAKDAMLAAMGSEVEKTEDVGGLAVTTRRQGEVVSFTAGGDGGFGGAVHGGGYFSSFMER
ncbi:MAG: hypothetical protein N2C14_17635 [Planctomycetales bacterium]